MVGESIEKQLKEIQEGDFVRVFYRKRTNLIKIRAGYANPYKDGKGIFVSGEFGYDEGSKKISPMGAGGNVYHDSIKTNQILKLELIKRREEVENELEELARGIR